MRLIDANEAVDRMKTIIMDCAERGGFPILFDINAAIDLIEDMPTVDAEPVRHGRWIEKQTTIQCSNCGKEYNDEILCMCYGEDAELKHCPMCGVKMDEKE